MTERVVRAGQRLGNYKLMRLLGAGTFADVYLAEHLYLNTRVAIKVLHAHPAGRSSQDFLTEARSEEHTSELQSPDHLVCRLLLEKKNKSKATLAHSRYLSLHFPHA